MFPTKTAFSIALVLTVVGTALVLQCRPKWEAVPLVLGILTDFAIFLVWLQRQEKISGQLAPVWSEGLPTRSVQERTKCTRH